ncbi:MAG TPA: nucleotidyltransferase domain-containing protein [Candidatus Lokiarchaeia archaeon]|nr:nucleotidyltransferase domain-containing protein [Candidatus Lokiarchaeia archaeon]
MIPDNLQMEDPEAIYQALLEEARNDPNIIGFFLGGSRGKGLFTKYSDYDVVYVIDDDHVNEYKKRYPRYNYKQMELLPRSMSDFRKEALWGAPDQWARYDCAWLKAEVDKTGEIQQLIDEKGRIPEGEVKKFIEASLDAYINYFYRSLKCFRDGYYLGARLEATIELGCLFNLLFAIHDCRLVPFYKYLAWELELHPLEKIPFTAHEFINKISRILHDADVETQREIFLMVEKLCRDEGHGHIIDGWEQSPGQEDMVLMRTFHHQRTPEEYRSMAFEVPLVEYDPEPHAKIEPAFAIEKKDVPEQCVICFFKDVIDELLENPETREIARDGSVMGDFPFYETVFDGKPIVIFHPGLGAPLSAGLLEFAIQLGCDKFVVIGTAGAVQTGICSQYVVVPVSAVRDEGTSYHYLPPSREVDADPDVVHAIEEALTAREVAYVKGKTWTTDAYYRETPTKIEQRRSEGCVAVEMEAAAFFAVAKFRNVKLGQILLCCDDVSGETWNAWGADTADLKKMLFSIAAEACFKL